MIDGFNDERVEALEKRLVECEAAIYDLQYHISQLYSRLDNENSLERVKKALQTAIFEL